jgi:integrase
VPAPTGEWYSEGTLFTAESFIYCGKKAAVVSYPLVIALGTPASDAAGPDVAWPAPVEYSAAVDRYLGQAALSVASRRVYRISLAGWAWPLVGKPIPCGAERRRATPPLVSLALLDDPGTGGRLGAAFAERAACADARTVNRELSALRSAVGWWRGQGWVNADPTSGLRHRQPAAAYLPLRPAQVSELFGLTVSLREQALWRLLYDCGAPAAEVLALDANRLDLTLHRVRPRPGAAAQAGLEWREATGQILRWLLSGRTWGPVFLTDRKAPARTATADVCPLTGEARMSYRRAAEIFAALTRPLDPAGRGWTLHQLSSSAAGYVQPKVALLADLT